MLKPYLIVGALIMLIVSFAFGYRTGGNAVTVKYQADLARQEAEAQEIIRANFEQVQTIQAENDKIKSKLENERQINAKKTNELRVSLNANSLRFKSSTSGQGGSDQVSSQANSSSNTNSTTTELPASITASLREIAYDCDTLRDDYALLYNFTRDVK